MLIVVVLRKAAEQRFVPHNIRYRLFLRIHLKIIIISCKFVSNIHRPLLPCSFILISSHSFRIWSWHNLMVVFIMIRLIKSNGDLISLGCSVCLELILFGVKSPCCVWAHARQPVEDYTYESFFVISQCMSFTLSD